MKMTSWCGLGGVALIALTSTGCRSSEAAEDGPAFQTAAVERGDLSIRAEATGTVEPVRVVEVKSKASGEILRLLTDIGELVAPGALLAEIDPRDVRNRFDQARADLEVARARAEIASAQLDRSTQLLDAGVLTQQEHEGARLEHANAQAALVKAVTNFELAELQLNDANIRAPMAGTIIQKNVEVGTVIQSASQNVSGGTTLFTMANLDEMQVRTLVDETDMGELRAGMPTVVTVEAYPNRSFRGEVGKIEPQAVVEQNVTMFPVIVTLDNSSGLLRPGMNAEVEILVDDALGVLLVPNNAVVQPADVGPAAMALGLDLESVDLSAFTRAGRGIRRGGAAPEPAGAEDARRGASGGGAPAEDGTPTAGTPSAAASDPPARIRELRSQVEGGTITEDSMRTALRGLRAAGGGSGMFMRPQAEGAESARGAAVFVVGPDGAPQARLVQIGLNDWDYTEVVSGLEEGEVLAVVGAAQLQAQQQEFLARMRSRNTGPFGGGGGPVVRGPGR